VTWREFLNIYADTLAVALGFATVGAGFVLWINGRVQPITQGQALLVIAAALLVACIATAILHGYLGLSIFLAPLVGTVCGLVALPLIRAIIKAGTRVEARADDIADKAIDKVTK
jgi:uncharacterized membrane protein